MVLALKKKKKTHWSTEHKKIPERNPGIYGQFIYNKIAKNIQWEKNDLFNKRCWKKQSLVKE